MCTCEDKPTDIEGFDHNRLLECALLYCVRIISSINVLQTTEEQGEFSCGWVHLPLVEATGNIVNNRQFDLHVNGGTPYEKGVEVDPSISRRSKS